MPLVQSSGASLVWHVESLDDVPLIQARARHFLSALGVPTQARGSVVIAASEAATNLIKHAGSGELSLAWVESPPRIVLETRDEGPGIADPEQALTDFFSEGADVRADDFVTQRRGMGTGLGSIMRMMDGVTLANRPGGGLHLEAYKNLVRHEAEEATQGGNGRTEQ